MSSKCKLRHLFRRDQVILEVQPGPLNQVNAVHPWHLVIYNYNGHLVLLALFIGLFNGLRNLQSTLEEMDVVF